MAIVCFHYLFAVFEMLDTQWPQTLHKCTFPKEQLSTMIHHSVGETLKPCATPSANPSTSLASSARCSFMVLWQHCLSHHRLASVHFILQLMEASCSSSLPAHLSPKYHDTHARTHENPASEHAINCTKLMHNTWCAECVLYAFVSSHIQLSTASFIL